MTNDNRPGRPDLKVVEFKPAEPEVNQSTVEILERALADAKAGKVLEVAIAFVEAGGTTATEHSESAYATVLLAGICRLMHRLQLMMDETATQGRPPE